MPSNYSEFQGQVASEKIALVSLNASERLVGFSVHSGSVYVRTSYTRQVIASMEQDGTALTEVSDLASVVAGTYYLDRENASLYVHCSGGENPNSVFVAGTFMLFFSSAPGVNLPWDLSTGFEVNWKNLVDKTSSFGSDVDPNEFIGVALEGTGSVTFLNELEFWQPLFDVAVFENQGVTVYSHTRDLPVSEIKKIYSGKVVGKSWERSSVKFKLRDQLNALRTNLPLSKLSDLSSVTLTDESQNFLQREVYGLVNGHRPQNIDHPSQSGDAITGTGSITSGSPNVTGSGTAFLTEVLPDDELDFGDGIRRVVSSVTNDTALVLTEDSDLTSAGATMLIFRSREDTSKNRTFLVAGHALKEPLTSLESIYTARRLKFASVDGIYAGADVTINGEAGTIQSVSVSNKVVILTQALTNFPTNGDVVTGLSVWNVYIDKRKLVYSRDYTIDATNGRISLTSSAEFNVAPVRNVSGTVDFTDTSRDVTGTNTNFTSELEPGDYIRSDGESAFFQILEVTDDTNLILRTAASYTASSGARKKSPEFYTEGSTVLSCSCLGKTDDGTKLGTLISTAPGAVEDILKTAGLTDILDTASFTTAKLSARQLIGIAIPSDYSADATGPARGFISQLNESVLGSVFQTQEFNIAYKIFEPNRLTDFVALTVKDILKFTVDADTSNIYKSAQVRYDRQEYNPLADAESFSVKTATNEIGQRLAKSQRDFIQETRLVDSSAAQTAANRWAFIKSIANTTIKVALKMRGQTMNIHDGIDVQHDDLYYSLGIQVARRIALVSSYRRSPTGVDLELNDLSNAFNRCGIITSNDAPDYSDASEDDRVNNGYITDSNGMIANDPNTFGKNLIW